MPIPEWIQIYCREGRRVLPEQTGEWSSISQDKKRFQRGSAVAGVFLISAWALAIWIGPAGSVGDRRGVSVVNFLPGSATLDDMARLALEKAHSNLSPPTDVVVSIYALYTETELADSRTREIMDYLNQRAIRRPVFVRYHTDDYQDIAVVVFRIER